MTDNGKVFTGKHFRPPVEVLFEKVCRESGIEKSLNGPISWDKDGREPNNGNLGAGLSNLLAIQRELSLSNIPAGGILDI